MMQKTKTTKKCSVCYEYKTFSEYYWSDNSYSSACKVCVSSRNRKAAEARRGGKRKDVDIAYEGSWLGPDAAYYG